MYGLPQLKHLNATNDSERLRKEAQAQDRAALDASRIEYDDETGHGISEDETIVSPQAQ